jgi:hypothetical protein
MNSIATMQAGDLFTMQHLKVSTYLLYKIIKVSNDARYP